MLSKGNVCLIYCAIGRLYKDGTDYESICNIPKGSKIGVLLDMHKEDLKFFVNS